MFLFFAGAFTPVQVPQVTMAMKPKKERFHVGALNRDLERERGGVEGETSRQEEKEGGSCSKTYSKTLQAIEWGERKRERDVGVKRLTVLESNSCLFCARTFSTPA